LEKPSAALGFNPGRLDKDLRFLAPETLPDSLLPYIFRARTWTGRGGGGAIRKSTGWDLSFASAKPNGFPQRKARPFLWKNRRLVVLRSVALPPRPAEALELHEPFLFFEK
jgi:hypothetical protein